MQISYLLRSVLSFNVNVYDVSFDLIEFDVNIKYQISIVN